MILGQLSMGARQTKNAPLLIYMWSQENGFPHVWVIYFRLCVIYVQAGWFVWCAKRASAVYWHLWYWVSTINWIGRKGHLQFIGFLGHYFTPGQRQHKTTKGQTQLWYLAIGWQFLKGMAEDTIFAQSMLSCSVSKKNIARGTTDPFSKH